MRKRYKNKKGSCALCHPEKTGHAKRFPEKYLAKLAEDEKVIHSLQGAVFSIESDNVFAPRVRGLWL